MKSLIKLLIVTIIVIINVKINIVVGQVTVANNTISSGDYVGSGNSENVVFKAGGTEYMRLLQSNGRLGIGSGALSAPAQKLEVDNDINLTSSAFGNGYRIGNVLILSKPFTQNLFIGEGAGTSANNSNAYNNTFVGYKAGYTTNYGTTAGDGSDNTFIGNQAGENITKGHNNVFVGSKSGSGLGSGSDHGDGNVFVGYISGNANRLGNNNCFIGNFSGQNNRDGSSNVFIGLSSGNGNLDGTENVFIGSASAANCAETTKKNVFVGADSGNENEADSNSFVGYQAGSLNTTGSRNSFFGFKAGDINSTGSNNTYLGHNTKGSGANAATLTNATAIGAYATVTTPNSLVLGSIDGENGASEDTKVGIGISAPTSKLDVRNTTEVNGVYSLTNYSSNTVGYGVVGESENATYANLGVAGFALSTTSAINAGIVGFAEGSDYENHGVDGRAEFTVTGNNTRNFGVRGSAEGSDYENFGGRFKCEGSTGVNYAVYGTTTNTGTNYWAGYFNGDVAYTGTITDVSDARLKEDVKDIEGTYALDIISQLQPKNYLFKRSSYPNMSLPSGKHYGLIAQEVEAVFPDLVNDVIHPSEVNDSGQVIHEQMAYKGINYIGFIPLLLSAVKEQQQVIDSLNTVINDRLTVLENGLSQCCGSSQRRAAPADGSEVNNVTVELNALQVIVLEQNVPNPFAEQTSISYFIPADAGEAQILFTDITGRVIKATAIEKGYGTVTVFAQNLSTGTYSYSLIIDGKVIETKKMLKTR